jgi:diaminohydroxyphosphoribosylaminopyrimidine deaminase/5-amino-6-(5-phosphoribosylamino)uracil reductase
MDDNHYMRRCFELARQGAGYVSPNPMVGAVLVHEDHIIGEGFHQAYGQAHAEVNTISSVKPEQAHLIPKSTLYVSLEPCCIFGRTPPCTNLIIDQKIPRVVISTLDETPEVSGKGVKILEEAGVEVVTGVLEEEGRQLAAIRNTFVSKNRPYIILKYAVSNNGVFAPLPARQLWLSNQYSKRLVHRWRMETDAILVGTNTALTDKPSLTNRLYFGPSPIRIVIDRDLALEKDAALFNKATRTIFFTRKEVKDKNTDHLQYIQIDFQDDLPGQIISKLAEQKITSLLIEGGAMTLESFINANLWDEARILVSDKWISNGIPAPDLQLPPVKRVTLDTDRLEVYKNS